MTKLTGIIMSENKLTGSLGVRNEINVDIIGTGARGKEGKSAYESWLDLGNEGTEQEYLASLKGDDGYTPVKGVDYFDGHTPVKGIDYFDGEQGIQGVPGEKGDQGLQGADGLQGVPGLDGLTTSVNGVPHVNGEITLTQDNIPDGTTNKAYTATEKTKLAGVAAGANKYTHPTKHPPSIITQDASNRFVTDAEKAAWNAKLGASQKGVANGVASLDGTGKVPSGQLPQVGLLPQIIITTKAGATVTATSGGKTVSGTATGGTCTLDIPAFGTWLVTATFSGKTVSETVVETVVVDTVKIYEIDLSFYYIYGFTINEAESNPVTSVTYTDEATAFSKGSVAWDTSPLFANVKPCIFKDGAVVGYLQRNDYTKFENGTAADITSGSAGDVMVEIPKMAYYMEKSGDVITCKVLIGDVDAKTFDAKYSYLPFSRNSEGDRDKIYIGAYLGYDLSSKLRSLSGKAPTANLTIGAFRTLAQANGIGYQQLPFYQLTLLQILYIMKCGSLDSQTALGRGYVDGNAAATATGGTNAKGFCFGETTGKQQMKIFGIEDFWGNLYQWIDGLYCNASWTILTTYKAFNDTGSGYLFSNSSGDSANTSGYMTKAQGGTQTGFNIKAGAGSETTYYADNADLSAGRLPRFGGNWAYASNAGAFQLYVSYSAWSAGASLGARLCYI